MQVCPMSAVIFMLQDIQMQVPLQMVYLLLLDKTLQTVIKMQAIWLAAQELI